MVFDSLNFFNSSMNELQCWQEGNIKTSLVTVFLVSLVLVGLDTKTALMGGSASTCCISSRAKFISRRRAVTQSNQPGKMQKRFFARFAVLHLFPV